MNTKLYNQLMSEGFLELEFELKPIIKELVISENYLELDQFFKNECQPKGNLYQFLNAIFPINHLEHIIAVRSSPDDEDGIWHDDGSRHLGFSLSLNIDPATILGGNLEFKLKTNSNAHIFSPRRYGTIIIFLTGQFGYEHKVTRVEVGVRKVIAGWGSRI